MQRVIGILSFSLALWPLLTLAAILPESSVPEGRIIQGKLAEPKQFPYQAGLLLYKASGDDWCGGVVISNRWILTAALCTLGLGKGIDIYLGTVNRLDKLEEGQQIIFVANNPRNIIVHDNFIASLQTNDIALVKIPAPVGLNDYVQPAHLVAIDSDYVGLYGWATGWGHVTSGETEPTDKLRWFASQIVTNDHCNQQWLGRALPTNICTMVSGSTTCTGDTGGPLVVRDTRVLIGITSFHFPMCTLYWPMVYTRITSYLEWIKEHTGVVPVEY